MKAIDLGRTSRRLGRANNRFLTLVAAAATVGVPAIGFAQDTAPPDGIGEGGTGLRYLMSNGDSGVWVRPERTGEPFIVTYMPAVAGVGAPVFNVEYMDVTNGTGVGFDDAALGAARQATVGAVITVCPSCTGETTQSSSTENFLVVGSQK